MIGMYIGYNGFCRGIEETEERWRRPEKYTHVIHAELNAICNAARSGVSIENSICVLTLYPCMTCCKSLIQAGIKTIVSVSPNFDDPTWGNDFVKTRELCSETGVEIIEIDV